MPGPVPKQASIRQRQNKVSTAATLAAEPAGEQQIPELLPAKRKWHPMTLLWWGDVWTSPMAPEYLKADIDGLYQLADLINRYWRKPTVALATEIRLQRQCYGLSPIDRRRLQWEVEKVESVTSRNQPPPAPRPMEPADDPRNVLRIVS